MSAGWHIVRASKIAFMPRVARYLERTLCTKGIGMPTDYMGGYILKIALQA